MIYSVYWDDERVTVVDAPEVHAVEALIRRHECDDDNCAHCDLFSFAEGVDDDGMKPVSVTIEGYVAHPAWWSSPVSLYANLRGLFLPLLARKLLPQEPHAYWPTHP
jgi:hypothetical protein